VPTLKVTPSSMTAVGRDVKVQWLCHPHPIDNTGESGGRKLTRTQINLLALIGSADPLASNPKTTTYIRLISLDLGRGVG
jgi:hypothetical protein